MVKARESLLESLIEDVLKPATHSRRHDTTYVWSVPLEQTSMALVLPPSRRGRSLRFQRMLVLIFHGAQVLSHQAVAMSLARIGHWPSLPSAPTS